LYDPVGNRLTLKSGGVPTTSTYDAANRLVRAWGSGGITTYLFDGSGNQVGLRGPSSQVTTLGWDGENRLTTYNSGSTTTFAYDGDGRRVLRWDGTSGTTKYVWDGQTVLLETSGSNVIQAVHTLRPFGYGKELSQRRSGVSSYHLFDGLGSTDRLTSGAGSVTDSYLYNGFGQIITSSGSTSNALRFVGQQGYAYESALVLYFVGTRWYNPLTGAFVSKDPIGFAGRDSNLYRYVGNDPIGVVDPSGLNSGLFSFFQALIDSGVSPSQAYALIQTIRAQTTPSPWNPFNQCQRFAFALEQNLPHSPFYTVDFQVWDLPPGGIWQRHVAMRITTKNGQIFYLDNGGIQWYAGHVDFLICDTSRISPSCDVPPNWKPIVKCE
jgi:RHS repeat-associated protein